MAKDKVKYNETLKYMRTTAGFTQKELAKKINIPHQTFSSYERRHNKLPLETFIDIANACEFEIIIKDQNSKEERIVISK